MIGSSVFREPKVLLLAVAFVLGALFLFRGELVYWYEQVAFSTVPSAERAYRYGDRHFDAMRSDFYNIGRAEGFYREALELDFAMPLVRHQLARIDFLRGEFPRALSLIDAEIALPGGPASPSSYYVRGLILGYMGRYSEAAEDYQKFIEIHPGTWAAANDYAWVLLKAERFEEAADAAEMGLATWPESPWLLNSKAIALYELGELKGARAAAEAASKAAENITEEQWLIAYPGNDPRIALEGIAALKNSIAENMHTITAAVEAGGL